MYLNLSITIFFHRKSRSNGVSEIFLPKVDPSLLVLGIISADNKIDLRNAQRTTWLSKGLIQYRYLLDRETPALILENDTFGDLVFLNATHSGYATAYGEKLDLWFKYAWEHFPNVTLYGKADDDVYVCACQMYAKLHTLAHNRLYYGWMHSEWMTFTNRMKYHLYGKPLPLPDLGRHRYNFHDEMFVLVGRDLIEPLISREYCYPKNCEGTFDDTRECEDPDGCISNEHNWDTNIGDTSLVHWMNDTSGYNIDIVPGNKEMLHYQRGWFQFDVYNDNLCDAHLVKHGLVTPDEMEWIFTQKNGDC